VGGGREAAVSHISNVLGDGGSKRTIGKKSLMNSGRSSLTFIVQKSKKEGRERKNILIVSKMETERTNQSAMQALVKEKGRRAGYLT